MANLPVRLSFSFIDKIDVPASLELFGEVSDTSTVAQLVTAGNAYLSAVAGVSDAGVIQASVKVELDVSAFVTPGSDSNCEQGLLLNYGQEGSQYKFGVWVPSLKDAIVVNGKIDLTNAALSTLNGLLTAVGGTIDARSKYQLLLTALKDAAESFRKLRRRAEKVTKVTP